MMMAVTVIDPPKSGVETYFIAGDWHSFHLCKKTLKLMIDHALSIDKNKTLIINGDFIDCPYFMKKSEDYKAWVKRADGIEEFFLPKWEEEMRWANDMIDDLQMIFKKIIFIEGNHDWRASWFVNDKCPHQYRPHFNTTTSLNLLTRKIKHVKYNDWLDIGDLSITHGMFHGSTSNKKHYEASGGRSVIYSHIHKYSCTPFASRGDTKQVWSLPAMCTLNPHYIKNTENNWTNGYGIINMHPNGNFNFNVFQKWNDKIVLPHGSVLK